MNDITDSVDILEYIGQYTSLEEKNGEYVGLCPFHSERTPSFYVNPENKKWYCFGCKFGGNVISFAAKINGISYGEAEEKIAAENNLHEQVLTNAEKIYRQVRNSKQEQQAATHPLLDKNLYDIFSQTQIPLWIREGIPQHIMDRYEVRMDLNRGRIVYPVYDNDGNFINVKGRTVYSDYKELSEPKYINYFKVGKVDYFQCFFQNAEFIRQAGEIIIFEGIKSVMKLESYGFRNSVSAETSKINEYQLRHLIRLGVDVTIAFDNDVKLDCILDTLQTLSHFTNVYYISDTDNLLNGEKLSPVDKGKEVWQTLYEKKRRVLYV